MNRKRNTFYYCNEQKEQKEQKEQSKKQSNIITVARSLTLFFFNGSFAYIEIINTTGPYYNFRTQVEAQTFTTAYIHESNIY